MYRGKYLAPKRKRRKKLNMFFVALVLLFLGAVGGTMAFLLDTTSRVENTFTPAEVKISINETVENNTKSGIYFTNSDDSKSVPVYIRATLAVYWTDTFDATDDGVDNPTEHIVPKPVDPNVGVTVGEVLTKNGWFQVGDIYYYAFPVAPGDKTKDMLTQTTVSIPADSTLKCYIDVRAEAIQAEPKTAVETAWKDVQVGSDGRLSAKTSGGA